VAEYDPCLFCGKNIWSDDIDSHRKECGDRKALRNSLVVTFAGLDDDPIMCWEKADAILAAGEKR
jgi:hypothetical protein